MEDEDVCILIRQSPINHFGFRKRVRFEIDQAEKIQDVGIIGTELLRALQLPPRLGIAPLLEPFPPAVVVKEKNALIEWRGEIRH